MEAVRKPLMEEMTVLVESFGVSSWIKKDSFSDVLNKQKPICCSARHCHQFNITTAKGMESFLGNIRLENRQRARV